MMVPGRLLAPLAIFAALLAGCDPVRELETGEQLLDRFWQGVPRDAFGENLDEPTVRDVRRVLRLPVGCVASFDRDNGMLFVRAPAEELQSIDRSIAHAEPDWEGPIQLRITASALISKTQPPNPWDAPQSAAQILEGAVSLDRHEVSAFLGVQAETRGNEKRPLPPEAEDDDYFEDDILRRWEFSARSALADDSGTLDVDFRYKARVPSLDDPDHFFHAELKSQCLLALGQPRVFELGTIVRDGQTERLVFAIEATRINPMGLPEPEPEPEVGDEEA